MGMFCLFYSNLSSLLLLLFLDECALPGNMGVEIVNLEDRYYVNETFTHKCRKGNGKVNVNITFTCLSDGNWSATTNCTGMYVGVYLSLMIYLGHLAVASTKFW